MTLTSYIGNMTSKLYFAIIACALFAAPVSAQQQCAGTADVYAMLTVEFGESRTWIGQHESGNLLELWGNPDSGTWTLLGSQGGMTCMLSNGVGYSTGTPL